MHNIPVWVYVVFFLLVYLGIKHCFANVTELKRLLIMPLGFLYLSLHSLYKIMLLHYTSIFIWLLAFLISVAWNIYHVRNHQIRADKQQRLIEIPGDWTWLVLILIIFFVEFFINYLIDSGASSAHSLGFVFFAAACSGLVAGISIGRNLHYYIKYLQAKHTNLVTLKHSERVK